MDMCDYMYFNHSNPCKVALYCADVFLILAYFIMFYYYYTLCCGKTVFEHLLMLVTHI